MTNENLTLSSIKQDLNIVAYSNISNADDWRFSYIIPIFILAISAGIYLKSFWAALFISTFDGYHIYKFAIAYKQYRRQIKAIKNTLERGAVSISVEKLSHISHETIYEPHYSHRRSHLTKDITVFYFDSARNWRVPGVTVHYKWSKDHYISQKGLENISIQGDEFYVVHYKGLTGIELLYSLNLYELQ